ncbi:peptidoglycan bridge formation glycyltransferase FemA/FemB family protein [Arthrobacter sp. zg-ZUI100]|uniref:lipid II:glycine glycyltransferase FemX n=1 Tax=Arthrobacter jiangjiafuii TaxID=2817475 RepID=UPI001AEE75FB|nr:peptidoglycan bridge formation glycyltransferase FemA/FemB family protein [Arthrobacter jiangjiafuii]
MSHVPYRFEQLNQKEFEALAAAHPYVVIPLEQTPYWADFERKLGRTPYGIWAYYDGDKLVATASYLRSDRRLRPSLVVVNGPTWFAERTDTAEARLVATVQEQFRDDPAVDPLYIRMQVLYPQAPVSGPLEHGWYEREIVVDLTPDTDAIFASFRSNARNLIRKAEKLGVKVVPIERKRWAEVFRTELYPIMQETAARDGFSSFESTFYETLLTELGDHLRLMVAYMDGEAVSWLITTEYRGYSVYYFAASSHNARKTNAPYLLLWESFKVLKEAGNTACGLTGIVSENYPSLINVTTFKRNFSKTVVTIPTTYDIPLRPQRYALVATALKLRREAPRKLRALPASARALAARTAGRKDPQAPQ